jgi:hypothetical protein
MSDENDMRNQIASGVVEGFRQVAADKDLMGKFWKGGFDELVIHSTNASSQWIGKRIVTWLVGVVVVAGMAWLVRSGAIK